MIVAVGFKVNSERAVQFRKWVNQIVSEYAIRKFLFRKKRSDTIHFFSYFFLNCDGEQPFLLLINEISPLASEKPTSFAIAVTDKSVFLSKLKASFKRSSF